MYARRACAAVQWRVHQCGGSRAQKQCLPRRAWSDLSGHKVCTPFHTVPTTPRATALPKNTNRTREADHCSAGAGSTGQVRPRGYKNDYVS